MYIHVQEKGHRLVHSDVRWRQR